MNQLSAKELDIKVRPVVNLDALCQEIRERACTGEFDNQAYVSQDIIERLKQLGVYRALVPRRFGGDECSPRQFCELIEKLSMADGSVGWVASFGMSPAYLGSLPETTLQELYKDSPDIVFAGGFFHLSRQKLRITVFWSRDAGSFQAVAWALILSAWVLHHEKIMKHMACHVWQLCPPVKLKLK